MLACCLATVLAAAPAQAAPLTEDLEILQPWRDALGDAQATNTVVNTAVVGDSITTKRNTWVYWLRNAFWDRFGNAGEGSLDIHPSSSGDDSGGYVYWPWYVTSWGTPTAWTRTFNSDEPRHVLSVNGNWSTCEHSDGGWFVQLYGAQATLRYIQEPGAGAVTVSRDGEVLLTIDAAGSTQMSATVDIPLPGLDVHSLRFESTASLDQPQSVMFDFLDVRTGQPGSVIHRWGQGGRPCSYFLEKNEQVYQDLLDTVQPDVLWIQCDPAGEPLDQYELDLRALVARFQDLKPGMPVVLISHHHFSNGHDERTAIMYNVAADDPSVAFINVFDLHQDAADMTTLGYLLDDVHLTEAGGKFYAAWILRELLGWSRADLDLDGVVGQTDLAALLRAYRYEIGDDRFLDLADITRDGVVDQADLAALLADYGWSAP
jgi:hypothetical protein